LVDGEVLERAPIDSRHAGCVKVGVVDVNAEVVHVATPEGTRMVARGESLAPQAFPDLVLEVAAIVG